MVTEIRVYIEGGGATNDTRSKVRQGFNWNAVPSRQNLEEEPKQNLFKALERASENTKKGAYQKIRHATELLQRVRPSIVRSRCKHCERFFKTVETRLGEGT